jgi:Zn-dependent peptidase ImmA (M78 family)
MNGDIIKKAQALVRKSETTNPFRIADDIGAEVKFYDLGNLKGMYACIKRNRFIVINNRLDEYTQRIVCAHELGHDQLHRDLAKDTWLREFMIYNMNNRTEYEANVFACEVLLPSGEILELVNQGFDIEQIAREMCTDVNLVALKLAALSRQGYKLGRFESRNDFLR